MTWPTVRLGILLLGGIVLAFMEAAVWHPVDTPVLLLAGGMMGLEAFIRKDEAAAK